MMICVIHKMRFLSGYTIYDTNVMTSPLFIFLLSLRMLAIDYVERISISKSDRGNEMFEWKNIFPIVRRVLSYQFHVTSLLVIFIVPQLKIEIELRIAIMKCVCASGHVPILSPQPSQINTEIVPFFKSYTYWCAICIDVNYANLKREQLKNFNTKNRCNSRIDILQLLLLLASFMLSKLKMLLLNRQ